VPHTQLVQLQNQFTSSMAQLSEPDQRQMENSPRLVACLTRRKEDPKHEFKIIEVLAEKCVDPTCGPAEEISFDELVIQHSSHNHGQALILLFRLVDAQHQLIHEVTSAQFETITRRGIEKQKQKKSQATKKQQLPSCTLTQVSPSAAPTGISTFVKIEGTKLALRAREHSCIVHFGQERSDKVFLSHQLVSERTYGSPSNKMGVTSEEDSIIVSVPSTHRQGQTVISIEFGDGTSASNSLGFTFYNIAVENDKNLFVRDLITRPQTQHIFSGSGAFSFANSTTPAGHMASPSTGGEYQTSNGLGGAFYTSAAGATVYGAPATYNGAYTGAYSTNSSGGSMPNGNNMSTSSQQFYPQWYGSGGQQDIMDIMHKTMKNDSHSLTYQQVQLQQQLQQHQQLQHQGGHSAMRRSVDSVDGGVLDGSTLPPPLPGMSES